MWFLCNLAFKCRKVAGPGSWSLPLFPPCPESLLRLTLFFFSVLTPRLDQNLFWAKDKTLVELYLTCTKFWGLIPGTEENNTQL